VVNATISLKNAESTKCMDIASAVGCSRGETTIDMDKNNWKYRVEGKRKILKGSWK
jgi:hypothetical protein